ncbi:hypothetical protein ACQ4LE_003206 [Meloidogyne hapla]
MMILLQIILVLICEVELMFNFWNTSKEEPSEKKNQPGEEKSGDDNTTNEKTQEQISLSKPKELKLLPSDRAPYRKHKTDGSYISSGHGSESSASKLGGKNKKPLN